MTAVFQVLENYELIENILLYLPLLDLLLAQRITQNFHSVIQRSVSIKRALFFEALAVGPIELIRKPDDSAWMPFDKPADCTVTYAPLLNPLVGDIIGLAIIDGLPSMDMCCCHQDAQCSHTTPAKRRLLNSPNASWRRMLLSQPPVVLATFGKLSHFQRGRRRLPFMVANAEGLTVAEVADAAVESQHRITYPEHRCMRPDIMIMRGLERFALSNRQWAEWCGWDVLPAGDERRTTIEDWEDSHLRSARHAVTGA